MATTLNTENLLPVPDTVAQSENTRPAKTVKKARSIRDPDALPDFTHCEFYTSVHGRSLSLCGEWMPLAGFTAEMQVKIRVMKDCIVITPQNTRELWGCIEGMSVTYLNQRKVKQWLDTFPGALHDTGDIPVIKRGR
ncbi:type I toxin-antitoxin system SymE family toxin [Salmonella enterica subsp. enterica serovar Carno]|nr:type I toxin-antitoxin system SymE family toxin [Salmonella enterica]EDV9644818.1 type I toxin-antitoxin system SymE family toxin [Salmonella enterica subsp. enterica serovar Carno]